MDLVPLVAAVFASVRVLESLHVDSDRGTLMDYQGLNDDPSCHHYRPDRKSCDIFDMFILVDLLLADEPDLETPAARRTMAEDRPDLGHS